MSNPITRRFALFRIASAGAATAVAGVPVAIAAVQPNSPENPVLIELGDQMAKAAAHLTECMNTRAAVKAECERLWPVVPEELYADNIGSWLDHETERDCDDRPIDRVVHTSADGRRFIRPRPYASEANIRSKIEELPEIGGTEGEKYMREIVLDLLPAAVGYAKAKQHVLDATAYEAKVDQVYRAEFEVEQLLRQLSAIPAVTPLGITIKAEAYQACAATGKEGRLQASLHLSPSIADDVCRILSEGDEA